MKLEKVSHEWDASKGKWVIILDWGGGNYDFIHLRQHDSDKEVGEELKRQAEQLINWEERWKQSTHK